MRVSIFGLFFILAFFVVAAWIATMVLRGFFRLTRSVLGLGTTVPQYPRPRSGFPGAYGRGAAARTIRMCPARDCNHENPSYARFCARCGRRLVGPPGRVIGDVG